MYLRASADVMQRHDHVDDIPYNYTTKFSNEVLELSRVDN